MIGLPPFGLRMTFKNVAFDSDGNRIDYAIFPGDYVVTFLVFTEINKDSDND